MTSTENIRTVADVGSDTATENTKDSSSKFLRELYLKPKESTPEEASKSLYPGLEVPARKDTWSTTQNDDAPLDEYKPEMPFTAGEIGDFLKDNFETLDKNKDGYVKLSELKSYSEANGSESIEEITFARQNYFALRSLSDDNTFREGGISLNDVNQLYKNKKPETSVGDYISSVNGIAFQDIGHVAVNGALLLNAIKTLSKITNGVLIGAAGLKLYDSYRQFGKQQQRVSDLYDRQNNLIK